MLALIYLALMIVLGDTVCRRFFVYVSATHRWAAAFLGGLLISSWWTYLSALVFAGTSSPLFWGNIIFFVTAVAVIGKFRNGPVLEGSSTGFEKWDMILIGVFLLFTSWMMFATFNTSAGMVQIGFHEYSDFGPIVATMQSFAEGANFPAQSPIFAGEKIRSYFLFYFVAGNLEFLGLGPAMSLNFLSVLSTTAMLVLVMTIGRVLFDSKTTGRIGAALFFVQGSLSFIPFFYANGSFSAAVEKLTTMTAFLNSGLGHRGEDWGIWSQNVYLTQRNFAGSIGILLMVLIFLIMRYRQFYTAQSKAAVSDVQPEISENTEEIESEPTASETGAKDVGEQELVEVPSWLAAPQKLAPFIAAGIILGLMPMFNGAVLVVGLLLLATLAIVLPLRREMLIMFAVTALLAVPQLIYLKMGTRSATFSYFHWGYLLDDPSVLTILYYLMFTFGFKWLLMGIGVGFTGNIQRRFFGAVSALLIFALCTRLTEEQLVNHKFFNIWLVIINVFVAYGLVRLWQLDVSWIRIPARILTVILVLLVTISGVIDLMPIRNASFIEMKYDGDKLVDWIKTNTSPRAVFLSHRHTHHPILLAGRPLYFGAPYYAWESGYKTVEREAVYTKMFESTDAAEVFRLLKENNIKYVAIDDAIRSGREFIKRPNEAIYQSSCKLVFEDGNMKIYEVPDTLALR